MVAKVGCCIGQGGGDTDAAVVLLTKSQGMLFFMGDGSSGHWARLILSIRGRAWYCV